MKQFLIILTFVFIINLLSADSRQGVDISYYLTTTNWNSYFGTSSKSSNFAIIHAYFYNATVNVPGLKSIKTAWASGIPDISVYFYPCISSSLYVSKNSISCGSAESQLDQLLTNLTSQGISFRRYNYSTNSRQYNYDISTPTWNTTLHPNPILQTLYINIEDDSPNLYFSTVHYENVEYLNSLVTYAESLGIEVGIYTTNRDWISILIDKENGQTRYYFENGNYTTINPFARLKLWTPRYDGLYSLDDTTSINDWPRIFVKQLSGSSTAQRRIGTSRVCTDYIPTYGFNNSIIVNLDS